MKIVNLDRAEAYQLNPGTQLTVERPNPFFNDYAEQTVPVSMPASPHNMRLLRLEQPMAMRQKVERADCAISDGDYYAQCRQAILSVQRHGSISTSFYMNDGSLYSRLSDIKLKDIFDGQYVKDVNGNEITTVEEGIEFCRSLLTNQNPDYAIFPILVDSDAGTDDAANFKSINLYGKMANNSEIEAHFYEGSIDDEACDFWGATDRTDTVDGLNYSMSSGYYITPFIRCNTVLRQLFAWFGYTLLENFFTQTAPFSSMVFVNNAIDTLVNGRIRVTDLLPDTTARGLIDVFRKKFCCELSVNEEQHTVTFVFLKDAVTQPNYADLTSCVTKEPVITFNTKYRRITLQSQEQADGDISDNYDDLRKMQRQNPTAYFNPETGLFYKDGWFGAGRVVTRISNYSQPYDCGEELDKQAVTVPDYFPEIRERTGPSIGSGSFGGDGLRHLGQFLYVGKYSTLNSKLAVKGTDTASDGSTAGSTTDNDDTTDIQDSEDAATQKIILAIPNVETDSHQQRYVYGLINNYTVKEPVRLWDYSLLYNGDDGIFSRFWSYADQLYRNALDEVRASLLLTQRQKMLMPAIAKVIIQNQEFLFKKFKFTLGGKNEPIESEMKSLAIRQPVNLPPTMQQLFPMMATDYHWVSHFLRQPSNSTEYENAPEAEKKRKTFYPPLPTASYADGNRYFERKEYVRRGVSIATQYLKYTYWFTCEANE